MEPDAKFQSNWLLAINQTLQILAIKCSIDIQLPAQTWMFDTDVLPTIYNISNETLCKRTCHFTNKKILYVYLLLWIGLIICSKEGSFFFGVRS